MVNRIFKRFNAITKTWNKTQFKKLKKGDRFIIFHHGDLFIDENGYFKWKIINSPFYNKRNRYIINAVEDKSSYQILEIVNNEQHQSNTVS